MKKFVAVVILISAVLSVFSLNAGEYLEDSAWGEMRELHAVYLGKTNNMSDGETEMWIAQDMNRWLRREQTEYRKRIQKLLQENEYLKKQLRCDTSGKSTIVNEYDSLNTDVARLEKINNDLKEQLSSSITLSKITGLILGMIVAALLGIVLIKKCQSKKLPKEIKETIAKS